MRKSKAETAKTRQHFIRTAAAEFRRDGFGETGLADVMANAGLTHGGFYRHFDSNNELVAEVCVKALANGASTMRTVVSDKPHAKTLKAAAEKYLSPARREDRAYGCPLVALGSEIARCDGRVRGAATEGMVGALTLARIVDDPALSDRILYETRRHIATV